MYRPLSDEEKAKVLNEFKLVYSIRAGTNISSLSKSEKPMPVVVQLKSKNNESQKPIDIFTMGSKERENTKSYFFYDLKEVEQFEQDLERAGRKGRIKAIRVFLLDCLVKELLDYLKKENYKFIFVYSTIAYIPDIFMDYKFRIRATEKDTGIIRYLGCKGV